MLDSRMSDSPISDLIAAVGKNASRATVEALCEAALEAQFGLRMTNVPRRAIPNEPFTTEAGDHLRMATESIPDGRTLLKAFADPELSGANFPEFAINARIDGREMFEMLLKCENLDGVMLCSAVTFGASVIGLRTIRELLELTPGQLVDRAAARKSAATPGAATR
jgi:hypothetical protein